jgi:TubC N-terminal docking domain
VNALTLYNDLKARGVIFEAVGHKLRVDAPAGKLTEDDRAALAELKPVLLKLLSRGENAEDEGRRFGARRSKHPGYTSL